MKQKLCRFSDEEYAVLESIKNTVPEVNTSMGAIRFLIKKYQLDLEDKPQKAIELNDIFATLKKNAEDTIICRTQYRSNGKCNEHAANAY